MPGAQWTLPSGRRKRRRPACLGSQESIETSSRAGLQEVLPGPDNVLGSVHLLDSLGGAPVVMVELGAIEAATPSSFWCLGAAPCQGVVSVLAGQGGLLV